MYNFSGDIQALVIWLGSRDATFYFMATAILLHHKLGPDRNKPYHLKNIKKFLFTYSAYAVSYHSPARNNYDKT